jgi:hypothetical protein
MNSPFHAATPRAGEDVLVEEHQREVAEHLARQHHLGRPTVAELDVADGGEDRDLLADLLLELASSRPSA